jgi:peptidoglycan/xylan/chitin deacetylase (PgdA/CDA1 family)
VDRWARARRQGDPEGRRPRSGHRRATALAVLALAGTGIAVGVIEFGGGGALPVRHSLARPRRRRHRPRRVRSSGTALDQFVRLGRPVYCGGHRGHYVALTFDDGPGAYTPLALRILRRAHARATFFLVGRNLVRGPDLPRQELALGVLGDHTWTHPDLPRLTLPEMDAELARTQAAIVGLVHQPVRLFRPPYGAHDRAVDAEAHRLGMLEVLWSVDSADSVGANYRQIERLVLRRIRPGSIVLMHENHGQTIRALKYFILPGLRRRGLTPVSIPRLLALDPPARSQLTARGYSRCYRRASRFP